MPDAEHIVGRRERLRAVLITTQLCITVAVFSNVLEIVIPRVRDASHATGLEEANAFVVSSVGQRQDFDARSVVDEDLRLIRSIPGVVAATPAMGPPLTGLEVTVGISTKPGVAPVVRGSVYHMDEQGVDAFGVNIIQGQTFSREQVVRDAEIANGSWPAVIVSEPLAIALFDTADVVGRPLFIGGERTTTIIGVMERLEGPLPQTAHPQRERSLLAPQLLTLGRESRYLVRTEAGELSRVMPVVASELAASNRDRTIRDVVTLRRIRLLAYGGEIAIVTALGVMVGLLLTINAIGIYSMTSFWMIDQAKSVAVRRAVGASRLVIVLELGRQILLTCLFGVLIGLVLAFTLNRWLMTQFEMHVMSWTTSTAAACCIFVWALATAIVPVVQISKLPIGTTLRRL